MAKTKLKDIAIPPWAELGRWEKAGMAAYGPHKIGEGKWINRAEKVTNFLKKILISREFGPMSTIGKKIFIKKMLKKYGLKEADFNLEQIAEIEEALGERIGSTEDIFDPAGYAQYGEEFGGPLESTQPDYGAGGWEGSDLAAMLGGPAGEPFDPSPYSDVGEGYSPGGIGDDFWDIFASTVAPPSDPFSPQQDSQEQLLYDPLAEQQFGLGLENIPGIDLPFDMERFHREQEPPSFQEQLEGMTALEKAQAFEKARNPFEPGSPQHEATARSAIENMSWQKPGGIDPADLMARMGAMDDLFSPGGFYATGGWDGGGGGGGSGASGGFYAY